MNSEENIKAMTQSELRRLGIEALVRSLGPVGMVRFMQQFETGKGDYTKERAKWIDKITLDEITATTGQEN